MTRIALVVSDVDGTLLTKDKTLTDGAKRAVRRLYDAGIGFTITSSRPTVGMRFLIEPLAITLPVGPFNGSSIVDPQLKPIEAHLIPAATRNAVSMLNEFGVDIGCSPTNSGSPAGPTANTFRTKSSPSGPIRPSLRILRLIFRRCKIVGQPDAALLLRCEAAMQKAVGAQATVVRSQSYYLDITPPGHDKGTFVQAMAKRQGISTDAVATIGDMQNDLAMFKKSGVSVAMGNATDDVKKLATHVTGSNEDEGFAGAIEFVLKRNAS
jgi:Cof subfamily protein (haloacid dehalogenase superfamily)